MENIKNNLTNNSNELLGNINHKPPDTTPHIYIGSNGQLMIKKEKEDIPIIIRKCFPWSEPNSFYSLRDENDKEVFLIEDLMNLDPASTKAIEEELVESGFILEITAIDEISKEFQLRNWKVKTHKGNRTFQTRLEDWPIELADNSILISDIAGDIYHITDITKLDAKSQKTFYGFSG